VVRIIASRQAVLTVRLASGDLVVTVRNIRRHGRFVKARFPLMAGNWKMHGDHLQAVAQVQKLASALSAKDFDCSEVAVLPPFTSLRGVQTLVDGDKLRIAYGAQDLSPHDSGAYTGEVSGPMLAELGCRYVLAGHFEVRQSGQHVAYTLGQLDGSLDGVPAPAVASLVIAYEPVWAIGTGEVATAEDAQEAASAIRSQISVVHGPETAGSVRILYGGSVKVSNIAPIMAQPDVDGALVGGASLDAGQFAQICRYRELSVS